MSQHLRWSSQQLEEYLKRRHGENAAKNSVIMQGAQGKTRMQELLDKKESLGNWEHVTVKTVDSLQPPAVKTKTSSKNLEFSNDSRKPGQPLTENKSPNRPPRNQYLPAFTASNSPIISSSKNALNTFFSNTQTEPPARRIQQRSRSIATLDAATWSGSYEPGHHLEILFHGVVLLSVNTLYGLTHYERVKYRKRWHELVERAVTDLVGKSSARIPFDHYIVRAHRVSRRLADTDAKSGYLKYPIDGLRYSGVLMEDTELHFRDLLCSQALGLPMLALRIEAVEGSYIPMAMRDAWCMNMLESFSQNPKLVNSKIHPEVLFQAPT